MKAGNAGNAIQIQILTPPPPITFGLMPFYQKTVVKKSRPSTAKHFYHIFRDHKILEKQIRGLIQKRKIPADNYTLLIQIIVWSIIFEQPTRFLEY